MNRRIKILFAVIISSHLLFSGFSNSEKRETYQLLKIIADNLISEANFQFVNLENHESIDSIDHLSPDTKLAIKSPYNDWRYWNGVINLAMLNLSEITGDGSYSNYVNKNVSFAFDNYQHFKNLHKDENKWNYPFGQLFIMEELDDCGAMGASVIEVYKSDKQQRYLNYIKKSADHITLKQLRLEDKTLVRSFPVRSTIWADDLYMSISFLSRYGDFSGDISYLNDAAHQVILYNKYLFDETKGLMYHNWYSDIKKPGIAFWGRANGWAMMAQIDLLERLPKNYHQFDTLVSLFMRQILGLAKYQNKQGMWHQLLDKPDSYVETSCSAMFIYSIARAVNKGIIDNRYAAIAKTGWEGLKQKILPDGKIEGVCAGTVVYDHLKPYYERPTPLNDIHGIGAVILAGTEIMRLKRVN